jgi:hypothetical protein
MRWRFEPSRPTRSLAAAVEEWRSTLSRGKWLACMHQNDFGPTLSRVGNLQTLLKIEDHLQRVLKLAQAGGRIGAGTKSQIESRKVKSLVKHIEPALPRDNGRSADIAALRIRAK